jgi:hypothetical protein
MKLLGMTALFLGASAFLMAQQQVPEIDAGSVGSALTLLAGSLLVIRARRK